MATNASASQPGQHSCAPLFPPRGLEPHDTADDYDVDQFEQQTCTMGGEPIGLVLDEDDNGIERTRFIAYTVINDGHNNSHRVCEDCFGWLEDVATLFISAPDIHPQPAEAASYPAAALDVEQHVFLDGGRPATYTLREVLHTAVELISPMVAEQPSEAAPVTATTIETARAALAESNELTEEEAHALARIAGVFDEDMLTDAESPAQRVAARLLSTATAAQTVYAALGVPMGFYYAGSAGGFTGLPDAQSAAKAAGVARVEFRAGSQALAHYTYVPHSPRFAHLFGEGHWLPGYRPLPAGETAPAPDQS